MCSPQPDHAIFTFPLFSIIKHFSSGFIIPVQFQAQRIVVSWGFWACLLWVQLIKPQVLLICSEWHGSYNKRCIHSNTTQSQFRHHLRRHWTCMLLHQLCLMLWRTGINIGQFLTLRCKKKSPYGFLLTLTPVSAECVGAFRSVKGLSPTIQIKIKNIWNKKKKNKAAV